MASIPPTAFAVDVYADAERHAFVHENLTPEAPRAKPVERRSYQEVKARALAEKEALEQLKSLRLQDSLAEYSFDTRRAIAHRRLVDVANALRRCERFDNERSRLAAGLAAREAIQALESVVDAVRAGVK